MTAAKLPLLYAFDPFCGWCFAFTDVMAELRRRFADDVEWNVMCGGMVDGSRSLADGRGFLTTAMASVEERSTVQFGQPFHTLLDEGSTRCDSEPPCRATFVVEQQAGGSAAVDFGCMLSKMFYEEGKLLDDEATWREAAARVGVDADALLAHVDTPDAKAETQKLFAWCHQAGVRGYPMVLLPTSKGLLPLVHGYVDVDEAVQRVEAAIEAVAAQGG